MSFAHQKACDLSSQKRHPSFPLLSYRDSASQQEQLCLRLRPVFLTSVPTGDPKPGTKRGQTGLAGSEH